MRKAKYLCLLKILISGSLLAQELVLTSSPVYLKSSYQIPKNLLSTKTAVIVDAGSSGLDWKKISEDAHSQLRRTGVDAVAYFQWNKLFSGFDPQKQISDFLTTRQVENLIFISATGTSAEAWLTSFNNSWTFVSNEQETWYSRDSTISKALLPLYQRASLEQERKNFLISDAPEYYDGLVFNNQKINASYPPDVKGFRTCIAVMPINQQPETIPDGISKAYELYNSALVSRNDQIKNLCSSYYPFLFEFFDNGPEMDEIKNQKNCNFYLGYIYGRGLDLKRLFKSEIQNPKEITINSVLSEKPIIRNISADRNMFKFYLRNTVTGQIYIGSVWDADVSIEDALHNFIFYMKKDLKVNP